MEFRPTRLSGSTELAEVSPKSEDIFVCLDSALADQTKVLLADIYKRNII